jgi:hypothetical protein
MATYRPIHSLRPGDRPQRDVTKHSLAASRANEAMGRAKRSDPKTSTHKELASAIRSATIAARAYRNADQWQDENRAVSLLEKLAMEAADRLTAQQLPASTVAAGAAGSVAMNPPPETDRE